jgi:hypothetical protein
MTKLYKILFLNFTILFVLTFAFRTSVLGQDTSVVKSKVKKITPVSDNNRKLLLHKMDPDNFNFGVSIDGNLNLIGSQFGNRVGNFTPRIGLFFSKPVNKYFVNSFINMFDYAIEPVAINILSSRDKFSDNQYGGYYFDPSFALHFIPDRSSSDFRILLGVRPSYLMYSYSEVLENGAYQIAQSGLESNKNKGGDFDFGAMLGISFKFSQIGNFDLKYIYSFTDKSTVNFVQGRPSSLEFGIRLSAVQIGKALFDADAEAQKQVIKLNKGTLLVMFPTPNINEINALKSMNRWDEIKQIYYTHELNNKMVRDNMDKEYKFSKVLYFSDTSIQKVMNKSFENVFINENYQPIPVPNNFDSSNFLIASFCFDLSEYSSRNKLAYGLHVYNNKMELMSKPFNVMKNDMGLVPGNNVIAELTGKKLSFTPLEYETVVRKFNDRLLKSKMMELD